MARVIGNYACEWKVAVEDPATLKRFRTFVNSDEKDNNVVFVEERGQIRPASAEERAEERKIAQTLEKSEAVVAA
jgi:nitrite reductase (NADH) large subunit